MRKIFAILGALLTGGLGIALLGASQSASAPFDIELGRREELPKIVVIIGAIISGAIGVSLLTSIQTDHALVTSN